MTFEEKLRTLIEETMDKEYAIMRAMLVIHTYLEELANEKW